MVDVSTLKILLTLVKDGDKESFRNVQKMDSTYPDLFFDIVKEGIRKNPLMIRECMTDDYYERHIDFFVEFIKEKPSRISSIPSSAINKNLILAEAALELDGANLRHIPSSVISQNQYLLKKALLSNTLSLCCASRAFQKENAKFITECLEHDARGLKSITFELERIMGKTFDKIILNNPDVLPSLRLDQMINRKDVVLETFKKKPETYRLFSPDVKKHFKEMAYIAIEYDKDLLIYVPYEILEGDLDFCLLCSKECKDSAMIMPLNILQKSREIYRNCIENSNKIGRILTLDLVSSYYDDVLNAIRKNPNLIREFSDIVLKKYPEIVYEGVETDYRVYEYLSQTIREELPKAAQIAFGKNPSSLLWIPFTVLPCIS